MELTDLEGVGETTVKDLKRAGVFGVEDLLGETPAELCLAIRASATQIEKWQAEAMAAGEQQETKEEVEQPALDYIVVEGKVTQTKPPYTKMTFRGMKGRLDVGKLKIKGRVFELDVSQRVPTEIATAILGRPQYEFSVETEED